jgi:hypothetical protein
MPSLDGIAIVPDWMDPPPGYDVIGLPELPPDEAVTTVVDTGAPEGGDVLVYYTLASVTLGANGEVEQLPLLSPPEQPDSPSTIDESRLAAALAASKPSLAFPELQDRVEAEEPVQPAAEPNAPPRPRDDEPSTKAPGAPEEEADQPGDGVVVALGEPI